MQFDNPKVKPWAAKLPALSSIALWISDNELHASICRGVLGFFFF